MQPKYWNAWRIFCGSYLVVFFTVLLVLLSLPLFVGVVVISTPPVWITLPVSISILFVLVASFSMASEGDG